MINNKQDSGLYICIFFQKVNRWIQIRYKYVLVHIIVQLLCSFVNAHFKIFWVNHETAICSACWKNSPGNTVMCFNNYYCTVYHQSVKVGTITHITNDNNFQCVQYYLFCMNTVSAMGLTTMIVKILILFENRLYSYEIVLLF